jgi:hypothetical protein
LSAAVGMPDHPRTPDRPRRPSQSLTLVPVRPIQLRHLTGAAFRLYNVTSSPWPRQVSSSVRVRHEVTDGAMPRSVEGVDGTCCSASSILAGKYAPGRGRLLHDSPGTSCNCDRQQQARGQVRVLPVPPAQMVSHWRPDTIRPTRVHRRNVATPLSSLPW